MLFFVANNVFAYTYDQIPVGYNAYSPITISLTISKPELLILYNQVHQPENWGSSCDDKFQYWSIAVENTNGGAVYYESEIKKIEDNNNITYTLDLPLSGHDEFQNYDYYVYIEFFDTSAGEDLNSDGCHNISFNNLDINSYTIFFIGEKPLLNNNCTIDSSSPSSTLNSLMCPVVKSSVDTVTTVIQKYFPFVITGGLLSSILGLALLLL
jgi:hypothetical protein